MGGGGTTTTSGVIPNELKPLYTGSAKALLNQQSDNPLAQYNEANPLQVAGPNDVQMEGLNIARRGNQPSPLDAMALQSILRMTGLAGAGPTTGQYDYGSEAGLGDYQGIMNPEGVRMPNVDPTTGLPTGPNTYGDVAATLAQGNPPVGAGGGNGLPNGNGTPGAPPAGGAGAAPPGASKSMSQMSAADIKRMGGWDKSLSDLNADLSKYGISATGGGTGGLNLSGNGQSYTNVGASHEGAGPGGQSKFLEGAMGVEHGPGSYGKVAGLDSEIAGVAQRMRHAQSIGLDPNTSIQDLLKFKADQRASSMAAPEAKQNKAGGTVWQAAADRAAAARASQPQMTGADRKKKS